MSNLITKRLLEVYEMSRKMGIYSALAFERRTNIASSSINKWSKEGKDASLDSLVRILATFPTVSAEWVIRGEGPMEKTDQNGVKKPEPTEGNIDLISQLQDENKFLREQLSSALTALKIAHEHYNK